MSGGAAATAPDVGPADKVDYDTRPYREEMDHRRVTGRQERDSATPTRSTSAAHPLLGLQAKAGNTAVSRLVVQRQNMSKKPPAASQGPEPTLQSPDSDVNGKPVTVVGTDLQARTTRYRHTVDSFKRTTEDSKRQELDWYRRLDLVGQFIDLFNSAPRTDPGRWDSIPGQWDTVRAELDAALRVPITPGSINDAGQKSQAAIDHLHRVFQVDQQARAEFSRYLQGFMQSAQGVETVATVVRDISFAAAVAIAVVAAAPVVLAGATTATGAVGLTGTAATVVAHGGTAVAMGGLGATMEGTGQGLSALLVEGGGMLNDLLIEGRKWTEASARFSWRSVGMNTWAGMKRGFVDGVLAYAGTGIDKALARGTSVAISKVLGVEGAGTLAQILRMALNRAITGGASGSVIGALDAGIKSAIEGKSLAEVEAAMEQGFAIGALAGAVLGGAGGAFEGRTKAKLTAEISALQSLLVSNPKEFARRYRILVEGLTPAQRAAWQTELQGRRFVDRKHYEPASASYKSGTSATPPQHRYGAGEFHDWQEAATALDEHAASGRPLTQSQVQDAHAVAARRLTPEPGEVRGPSPGDVIGAGGRGYDGLFTALSPEQLAILERNPHIRLEARGAANASLTAEEAARRYQTAIIAYPEGASVQRRLDDFFRWYSEASRTMNPTELAASAQRELVSIHPFVDGNGRITRLVMDYTLRRRGLPPALLENPNLDYMVAEAAWTAEVRRGVVEAYQTTLRHVDLFNAVLKSGDLSRAATVWGTILGLTDHPAELTRWLYQDKDRVCR
ncbi:MAG: hypothetical protein QOF58_2465 [Pseudonocardiales bacterium]|jgi:prophage maintenance system killer protein|nr:hypothetical protein [Pseudonocardiales bacterium]